MPKVQTVDFTNALDSILRMVIALLSIAVGYIMWSTEFGKIHEYLVPCGMAALVSLVVYGISNYLLPLTKFEAWLYITLTNISLLYTVYQLNQFSVIVIITALSYVSVFVSVVLGVMRLLRVNSRK